MTPTPPTIDAPERRAKRTADHAGWIDQRALEIAQGIAAEEGITDVQTIARIQIGAIEGIKSRMAASSGERGAARIWLVGASRAPAATLIICCNSQLLSPLSIA